MITVINKFAKLFHARRVWARRRRRVAAAPPAAP